MRSTTAAVIIFWTSLVLLAHDGTAYENHNRQRHLQDGEKDRSIAHFVVSWSTLMTISTDTWNDAQIAANSSTTTTIQQARAAVYPDEYHSPPDIQNNFKLEIHLECPQASRLVMGLVDRLGRRIVPRRPIPQDSRMACGPPLTMNRNIMECRGIPQSDDDDDRGNKAPFLSFQKDFEVTCLGGLDDENDENQISITGPLLQLMVSSPGQEFHTKVTPQSTSSISENPDTTSGKVVTMLSESIAAARITNVSAYAENHASSDTAGQDNHMAKSTPSKKEFAEYLDSSDFDCISSKQASPSSGCSGSNESGGTCTRSVTCYQSWSPSTYTTGDHPCTAKAPAMTLSSSAPTLQHQEPTLQQQTSNSQIQRKDGKRRSLRETTTVDRPHMHAAEHHRALQSSETWVQQQARYRVAWPVFNLGCDEYTLLVDISCENSDSIAYIGTFSSWEQSQPQPTQGSNSNMECYQSVLASNTLHCRRTIPSTLTGGNKDGVNSPLYQDVREVDIVCTTRQKNGDAFQPMSVTVQVKETSNILCNPSSSKASSMNDQELPNVARTDSGLAIVQVMMDGEGEVLNENENTKRDHNGALLLDSSTTRSSAIKTVRNFCSSCQRTSAFDFYINQADDMSNTGITSGTSMVQGCQAAASCLGADWKSYSKLSADGGNETSDHYFCIRSLPSMTVSLRDYDQHLASTVESSTIPTSDGSRLSGLMNTLISLATLVLLYVDA